MLGGSITSSLAVVSWLLPLILTMLIVLGLRPATSAVRTTIVVSANNETRRACSVWVRVNAAISQVATTVTPERLK